MISLSTNDQHSLESNAIILATCLLPLTKTKKKRLKKMAEKILRVRPSICPSICNLFSLQLLLWATPHNCWKTEDARMHAHTHTHTHIYTHTHTHSKLSISR